MDRCGWAVPRGRRGQEGQGNRLRTAHLAHVVRLQGAPKPIQGTPKHPGGKLWLGTALTTTKEGAKVTVPGAVDVDRVGIVTTRCGTCGKVALFVGKEKVGVLKLSGTPAKTL